MASTDRHNHSALEKQAIVIRLCDNRIAAVDYLRGFSIFTIALMHLVNIMSAFPSSIQTLAKIGGTGVHVFFVCSGIGLYLSNLKKEMTVPEFLKRRFTKIYLPYIIVIIVSFFLPWLYKGDDRVIALLSHVFLFKMFVSRYEESFGTQLWFVSTIIQFYFIFIPMYRLKKRLKNNILYFGIFSAVSVSWWFFCFASGHSGVRIWSSSCLQYIWEFALGFVIADRLVNGKEYRIKCIVLLITAVVGIGLSAVMVTTSDVLMLFNDIPALLGYAALALLLMNISAIKRAAIWLSGFSYEYYLVHVLVFYTIFHFAEPKGLARQCITGVVSVICAVALAYFYHLLIQSIRRHRLRGSR